MIDEFSLFPQALAPEDVKKLFLEVAGANVHELIAQDAKAPSLTPVISSFSQPGLQIGKTTTLTISEATWRPIRDSSWRRRMSPGKSSPPGPNRLVAKVAASGSFVPGIYPLWVATLRPQPAGQWPSAARRRWRCRQLITARCPEDSNCGPTSRARRGSVSSLMWS
ncbi:MAG: hypothetical protein U0872_08675 [Planctomycetaceae bacterium]